MSSCVFAGTFDPITVGHIEIVNKCLNMFDKVFFVIGENPSKATFFSLSERLKLAKKAFESNDRVIVTTYIEHANYYEYLKENTAFFYVRGIRNDKDLAYEKEQESVNKTLYPEIKTVYVTAGETFKDISSSAVREKLLAGDLSGLPLPPEILPIIKECLLNRAKKD